MLVLNEDYWASFKKNMHKSPSRIILILCSTEFTTKPHQVVKYKSSIGNNVATKITPILPHAMQVKIEKSGKK